MTPLNTYFKGAGDMSKTTLEFINMILEIISCTDETMYQVLDVASNIALDLWSSLCDCKYYIINEEIEEYIAYNY